MLTRNCNLAIETEDVAYVRMMAVEAMRDEGFKMIDESDGSAALALLESDREIDLMISDVRLPGVSGYQLAKSGMARRPLAACARELLRTR